MNKEIAALQLDIEHHARTLARWIRSAQNLPLTQVAQFKREVEKGTEHTMGQKTYSLFYNLGIMEGENNLHRFKLSLAPYVDSFRDKTIPTRKLEALFVGPIQDFDTWFRENITEAIEKGIAPPYELIAPCMVAYGMQWNMHYTNCCSAFNLKKL